MMKFCSNKNPMSTDCKKRFLIRWFKFFAKKSDFAYFIDIIRSNEWYSTLPKSGDSESKIQRTYHGDFWSGDETMRGSSSKTSWSVYIRRQRQFCVSYFNHLINLYTLRVENLPMTCASKMLADYKAPYTATVVDRLIKKGWVLGIIYKLYFRRMFDWKGKYGRICYGLFESQQLFQTGCERVYSVQGYH